MKNHASAQRIQVAILALLLAFLTIRPFLAVAVKNVRGVWGSWSKIERFVVDAP